MIRSQGNTEINIFLHFLRMIGMMKDMRNLFFNELMRIMVEMWMIGHICIHTIRNIKHLCSSVRIETMSIMVWI